MHQRFQVHEPTRWVPLLFIFGSVLYAVVEVIDRGTEALTFWFLVTAGELALFFFLFRRNYVELGDGHLTWVQWGHMRCKIAFSEMRRVTRNGTLVSILLSGATPVRRSSFLRRALGPNWLSIPAVNPQGLTSTIESLLGVYGGRDAPLSLDDAEPPMPPNVQFIPAERWRRLLAAALDAFFLVGILFTVALAATAHLKEGEEPAGTVDFYALVVVLAGVLYIWIANVIGVSLGKLQLGLRVVRAGTDEAPGPLFGTVRVLAALSGYVISLLALFLMAMPVFYVGTAVLFIEFMWSLVNRERRAVHDIVARTRVVQTARRE